ncbi:MAG: hypothetical protein AAGB93_16050 [Planctomycetota bacterium]
MRLLLSTALLVVAALGVSCSSNAPASNGSAPAATLPPRKADKALVVFFRPRSPKGGAIQFNITEASGRIVGSLKNGTKFHEYVDPGAVTYSVKAPSVDGTDSVTIQAAAGEAYFLRGKVLMGWPAGRPKFVQETEPDAARALASM